MKSAAVGNPQGASQGQTIDAPISVMFPALKRTLNRAKSTRSEFEVLVSKENGRALQSSSKTCFSQDLFLFLSQDLFALAVASFFSFLATERDGCLLKVTRGPSLDRDPRCNITRSGEWWGG